MNARVIPTEQTSSRRAVGFRVAVPVSPLCPSCGCKFRWIEAGEATEVVHRTCRRCGERWQAVVRCLRHEGENFWVHEITLAFAPRAAGGAR